MTAAAVGRGAVAAAAATAARLAVTVVPKHAHGE